MLESINIEAFQNHHKTGGTLVCLGDQKPAFGLGYKSLQDLATKLGFSKVIDLDYNGKAAVTHDLNEPLPAEYRGIADAVYDGGTLEHVANVGEAFKSIVSLLKIGGTIVQVNPLNCYGDSYYGLDPMLPRDLYECNGFSTKDVCVYYRKGTRAALHGLVLRFLPPRIVERIRAHFRGNQAAKDFLMKDKRSDIITVPAFGNQWRHVPLTASLQYVGVKERHCAAWQWPAQTCYPKV